MATKNRISLGRVLACLRRLDAAGEQSEWWRQLPTQLREQMRDLNKALDAHVEVLAARMKSLPLGHFIHVVGGVKLLYRIELHDNAVAEYLNMLFHEFDTDFLSRLVSLWHARKI